MCAHPFQSQKWRGRRRNVVLPGRPIFVTANLSLRCNVPFVATFKIPPRGRIPGRNLILLWVDALKEVGSVSKGKKGPSRTVTTPENVERVHRSIQHSPRRSARKHAGAYSMSRSCLNRILHDEPHLHLYKMSVVSARRGNSSHRQDSHG